MRKDDYLVIQMCTECIKNQIGEGDPEDGGGISYIDRCSIDGKHALPTERMIFIEVDKSICDVHDWKGNHHHWVSKQSVLDMKKEPK
jgi:hypothetical protein